MKIHHTHKQHIKEFYQDGFSIQELVLMYKNKIGYHMMIAITRGVERLKG